MDPYIEKFKAYLSENPPEYGDTDVQSLMEMFYWHYSELNPINNEKIKACYGDIDDLTAPLGENVQDAIFARMCGLFIQQERAAFLSGFWAGAQWMLEAYGI